MISLKNICYFSALLQTIIVVQELEHMYYFCMQKLSCIVTPPTVLKKFDLQAKSE